jgi:hypothetical protein
MLLAGGLTWFEWALLGMVILCTAIVVSRAFAGIGGQSGQPAGQPDDETDRGETAVARRVANLEVRLHDFSREVEARLEKRAVELDGLVAVADREIARLTDLLRTSPARNDPRGPDLTQFSDSSIAEPAGRQATGKSAGAASGLSAAQEQMVCRLHEAGYSVPEIAHMVDRSPEAVHSVLHRAVA